MKWMGAATLVAVCVFAGTATRAQGPAPTADAVLAELKTGNEHHVAKKYDRPNQTAARQQTVASGQNPRCAILTCADSRVPPEIIFDKGLGDMFVIRVAGNIASVNELASLEFGTAYLNVPLVVVMGHSKCGAVEAAMTNADLRGHLPDLIAAIRPGLQGLANQPGDKLDNAIRANVMHVVTQLTDSKPVLSDLVAQKKVKIVGAVYSLATGKVDWLPAAAASR